MWGQPEANALAPPQLTVHFIRRWRHMLCTWNVHICVAVNSACKDMIHQDCMYTFRWLTASYFFNSLACPDAALIVIQHSRNTGYFVPFFFLHRIPPDTNSPCQPWWNFQFYYEALFLENFPVSGFIWPNTHNPTSLNTRISSLFLGILLQLKKSATLCPGISPP